MIVILRRKAIISAAELNIPGAGCTKEDRQKSDEAIISWFVSQVDSKIDLSKGYSIALKAAKAASEIINHPQIKIGDVPELTIINL